MGMPPPIPGSYDLQVAINTLSVNHNFILKHRPSKYYKEYGWYDIDATCKDCGIYIYYGGHSGSSLMWVWPDSEYNKESEIKNMSCSEYKMNQALE